MCLLDDYSKFELPNTEGVNDIDISIEIDEVLRINDKDYSITFATYFNVEWTEKRLFVIPELEVHFNEIVVCCLEKYLGSAAKKKILYYKSFTASCMQFLYNLRVIHLFLASYYLIANCIW